MSKARIRDAYRKVQVSVDTPAPRGPLDFYDGFAHLLIGGINYPPGVQSVVKYHGTDMMKVVPGVLGRSGSISAVFTDDQGNETLRLVENEWIGALDAWDIDTVGNRLTVRRKRGHIVLSLKLLPPGVIHLERLDMRFADAHMLVTPKSFAVGRYIGPDRVFWCTALASISRGDDRSSAIEFTSPEEIERRDRQLLGIGQSLATDDRLTVMHSNLGVTHKPLGIVIGSLCNGFRLGHFALGAKPVAYMRRAAARNPDSFAPFVAHSDENTMPKDVPPPTGAAN